MNKGLSAFYLNSRTTYSEIRDGTSYTIFYGEKTSGTKTHHGDVVDADFFPTWTGVIPESKLPLWRIIAWGADKLDFTGKMHDYSVYDSNHRGVSNFVFADGSVSSLSDSIDIGVFRALCTIKSREFINQDDIE